MADITLSNGANITGVGITDFEGTISVRDGASLQVGGGIAHSAKLSAGADIDVEGALVAMADVSISNGETFHVDPEEMANVTAGAQIDLKTYRPQTQWIIRTDDPNVRLTQVSPSVYRVYQLLGQKKVRFTVHAPDGEPHEGAPLVVGIPNQFDQDVIKPPYSGWPYFDVEPLKLGATAIFFDASDQGQEGVIRGELGVHIVDEFPDTPLVKNGSHVEVEPGTIIVTQPALLNNNVNNVTVSGDVIFGGDAITTNGSQINTKKVFDIGITHGNLINMSGGKAVSFPVLTNHGTRVNLVGRPVFGGDAITTNGSAVDSTVSQNINVSSGAQHSTRGWKEEPNSAYVINGDNVVVGDPQIIINAPDQKNSTGARLHVGGQKAEDILVKHRPVVALYRGKQIERSDISVSAGQQVIMFGVSHGGTNPDAATPCVRWSQSMKPGYCFVKGQIEEIPEISLDSSVKLGVQLYSCDNVLLNPSTFASAYFTFDDDLQLAANIDPVSSTIYVLARPDDFSTIKRKKIYDVRLHVVDQQGNPSIVLTRKLRFI